MARFASRLKFVPSPRIVGPGGKLDPGRDACAASGPAPLDPPDLGCIFAPLSAQWSSW